MAYTGDPRSSVNSWRSEMVGNVQQTAIANLDPKVLYTVRVQGYTAAGPGPFSRPVQIKAAPLPGSPGQVTDVTFPATSTDSFRIKWSPPSAAPFSSQPITGYKIYYNSSSGSYGYETVDAPTADYTVKGLRPSTDYMVYVTALSASGEGQCMASSQPSFVSYVSFLIKQL